MLRWIMKYGTSTAGNHSFFTVKQIATKLLRSTEHYYKNYQLLLFVDLVVPRTFINQKLFLFYAASALALSKFQNPCELLAPDERN